MLFKMLSLYRNNLGYASTCNSTGLPIGMFIGSVCPILLVSEEFNNKYFRVIPTTGGLMTLKSTYIYNVKCVYVICT